jgi:hypothetical protein
MNDAIAQARAGITGVLADVIGGRPCKPYRPARVAAAVAPAVWVGDHRGEWRANDTGGGEVLNVVFDVVVVVDGADHAAYAALDAFTAAVFDRCEKAGYTVDDWAAATFDADSDTTLRGVTLSVAAAVYAATLCPPEPVPVTFPPEPITVGGSP